MELEVQDTGIGIAPAKQQHLFEKFQQLDSTFTRQQGGSGLGLSICRSLVEMMGGRIKVWSAGVGCGTTVTFSLPVRREQEDAVHVKGKEALAAAGDESGVRVLVVDNDPEFRHYFKTLLTKHGYYVLTAATADDALDAARRFRPQVVIVDLALPQRPGAELGDGADLVAQLQTGALIREIYCFMVTGYEPCGCSRAARASPGHAGDLAEAPGWREDSWRGWKKFCMGRSQADAKGRARRPDASASSSQAIGRAVKRCNLES